MKLVHQDKITEARGDDEFVEKADTKVQVLGVGIVVTSLQRVLEKIDQIIKSRHNPPFGGPFFVATINPEFVMQAQSDYQFRRILNSADLAIPDGVGLKLADKRFVAIPGRLVVQALSKSGYRIFFLGGRGAAKKMADKYGGESDPGEADIRHPRRNSEILAAINGFQPDILFVAYGAPAQEKWLWMNRHRLKARVIMGVGGAFDYLVGWAKLPPKWISDMGLEWLWRLVREPWRWRRQLRLISFAWRVLRLKFQTPSMALADPGR